VIRNPREDAEEDGTAVLQLYGQLPETPSQANSQDRKTATALQARSLPLATVESAFWLTSLRRLARSPDVPPLSPIRSLVYFLPVLQDLLDNPPEGHLRYLRMKVRSLSRKNRGVAQCS
jgi:hypothetical protein